MIVGISRAVRMICESSGIRSLLSQMMRTGLTGSSFSRQFSIGSSESTVPIPAMIPLTALLVLCTWRRAVSPVTHRESPVTQAIFPSAVIAYFMMT